MQNKAQKAIAAALSATLTFSGATAPALFLNTAYADEASDLQSQLDAANARLNSLYAQAEEASEQLNDTQVKLDETNAQIDSLNQQIEEQEKELKQKQDTLSDRVAANYKSGSTSLLDLLLSSHSFEELTSNIYYATKVSQSDAEAIAEVKNLREELNNNKSQLEQQKSEQESLLESQKSQQAALTAQAQEAQSYVDSLDSQVKAALEQQRQQEAAAAQAAAQQNEAASQQEANNAAQQNTNNNGGGNNGGNSGNTNNNGGGNNGGGNNGGGNSGGGNSGGGNSGGGNHGGGNHGVSGAWRSTVVSAAYAQIGGTYVWAACNPGARQFDCSGLTMYCYSCAGISISHSSGSQSSFCSKPISQAVAGDVVWRPGHVGIYVGGGNTIEALSPGQGIQFVSGGLYSFSRCGSPV